jgi:ribosomal protein S18 acetylase RimI-like enzyme
MIRCLPLGPGSELPEWLERLEAGTFGDSWGTLADHERLWIAPGDGFARWIVIPEAGEAELLRVAVAPSARRRGLARAILQAAEKDLEKAGIRNLHLEVRVSNRSARALYEAEGWRVSGLRPRYYQDGEDAIQYAKALHLPD